MKVNPETPAPSWSDLAEDFGAAWNRFWFTPTDARLCAVLRIVVGILAAIHFLDLGSGLAWWYGREGLLPPAAVQRILELTNETGDRYHFTYLGRSSGVELRILHGLAIIVSLAFAAGLFTRISGVLTLGALLAYVHRAPMVAGHVEPVLSFLIAYLIIAPAGSVWSLDRRLFRKAKEPAMQVDERSVAANIGLRLIQVHLAMFYAMMGLTKLYGDAWWEGSAIWILLAQTESRPLDFTGLRRMGQAGDLLINFWTHAVVYFELAFAVLIWNRFTRPVLLLLSAVVWLSVVVATGHLIFGLTMLGAGLAFAKWPTRTLVNSASV